LTAKVNAYTVSSVTPKDNWIQVRDDAVLTNGQQLWLDIDYIGEPHDGGQIRVAYEYKPYQGLVDSVGTTLSAKLKLMTGFVHTDGTGNTSSNIDTKTYVQPLVSYLPTAATDIVGEYTLSGGSIAGPGKIGLFESSAVCYVNTEVLDYSTGATYPLKLHDIVTAAYDNSHLYLPERGGNQATDLKSVMLTALSAATYKQAVVFGLALAKSNFILQNELLLYVWTYTKNSDENKLVAADASNCVSVDFFFINNRQLLKLE
jgi:hypothetical protein